MDRNGQVSEKRPVLVSVQYTAEALLIGSQGCKVLQNRWHDSGSHGDGHVGAAADGLDVNTFRGFRRRVCGRPNRLGLFRCIAIKT